MYQVRNATHGLALIAVCGGLRQERQQGEDGNNEERTIASKNGTKSGLMDRLIPALPGAAACCRPAANVISCISPRLIAALFRRPVIGLPLSSFLGNWLDSSQRCSQLQLKSSKTLALKMSQELFIVCRAIEHFGGFCSFFKGHCCLGPRYRP